jgi:hypothetical protein
MKKIRCLLVVLLAMSIQFARGAETPAVMTTAAFASNRKMSTSYWQRPDHLGAATREAIKLDARCAHDRTSPVTASSEPADHSQTFRDHLRNIDDAVFYFLDRESPILDSSRAGGRASAPSRY